MSSGATGRFAKYLSNGRGGLLGARERAEAGEPLRRVAYGLGAARAALAGWEGVAAPPVFLLHVEYDFAEQGDAWAVVFREAAVRGAGVRRVFAGEAPEDGEGEDGPRSLRV